MSTNVNRSVVLPICAAAVTVFGTLAGPAPSRADGGCVPGDVAGQVPRNARPGDNVCVSPQVADEVQQENATAQERYAGGGAYGPLTCKSGWVWREAFDGDGICVTPQRRQETWQENANAGVGPTGGLKPTGSTGAEQVPLPRQGVPTALPSLGGGDPALLAAVNDARTRPEKYPPNGDVNAGAGAKMTACGNPFANSPSLTNAAAAHNSYLATSNDPNLHNNPGGKLSWADGGPIAQAGYNSQRAEIVATGQGSEAAAVMDWMQNDANATPPWIHRTNILNCGITDAGAAHLAGGSQGNYWTVDMGTP
jgi:hypothetical protein